MYLEIYASVLIRLGYEVFYYADLEPSFEDYLASRMPALGSVEKIAPNKSPKRWSPLWIQIVSLNLLKRFVARVLIVFSVMRGGSKQSTTRVEFDTLTRKLNVLKDFGFKPDLVICMYLDMTKLTKKSERFLVKQNISWTGLLFHPEAMHNQTRFRQDTWFSGATNVGSIFFTEKHIAKYLELAGPKQIFKVFPDVTTITLGQEVNLNLDLMGLARGRKIVGLVGALDGNKKLISEFLKLSVDPSLQDFYFVLAGEIYESTLDADTVAEVRRLSGAVRENLFVYNKYIESEDDYNYLLSQVNILFACYKDFDSSANILAKSAFFEIPVLVTAETRMGRLVKEFNLGLEVPSLTHSDFASSIIRLASLLDTREEPFGFEDFREHISIANLTKTMGNYLIEVWEKAAKK
jgi:hypothetical protein